MGRKEALALESELGKDVATAVEFTGKVIKGFEVIPTLDLRMGGRFTLHGVVWTIVNVEERAGDIPLITISGKLLQ